MADFEPLGFDPDDGAPLISAPSFCVRCGDRSVEFMDSHLTDGDWTCDLGDAQTADNETGPATTQTAGKDPSNKAEEGKQ